MIEKKKSFIIYTDYKDLFDTLDNSESGELIKAMLDYAAGEEISEFSDRHIRACFSIIRKQMDRDSEKYAQVCRKRSEAAKRTAKAKAEQ
ncbi:MAG: hypothetical protein IJ007_05845 [Oscillospiraceae bacterium]|nr:hypothetical protein [Oscillospiraceae bacterium]